MGLKRKSLGSHDSVTDHLTTRKEIDALSQSIRKELALNGILNLLSVMENSSNAALVSASIKALLDVFVDFGTRGLLAREKNTDTLSGKKDPRVEIKEWIREYKNLYVKGMCNAIVTSKSDQILNMAFDCLLKFALAESTRKKDIDYLLYQQLLSRVLNHHESVPGFLDHVVKTLKSHEDVLFIAQKVMSDYLFQLDTATASSTTGGSANKNKKLQLVREATSVTLIVKNAYYILSRISPPSKDIELSNLFHSDIFADSKEASLFQFASRRKAFSQVWLGFLRHPLDGTTYKDILSSMHVNLLPHLVEPRLLIDFLVQAYDQGGVVALLALNGLFTLITKHNLDYPNFYETLYTLLDGSVLHVKYRSRFFELVDLFLTSSHLPVYTVAAFIKKLGRLSLFAPPAALSFILPLMFNLLRRHPRCMVLIHRKPEDLDSMDASSDPFDFHVGLTDCKALDSCLWELASIQSHHYLSPIRAQGDLFTAPLVKFERVKDFLNQSYASMAKDVSGNGPLALSPPSDFTMLYSGKKSIWID